jgi:leader peptidase (prepilin peptidase) / N-methyltransferase
VGEALTWMLNPPIGWAVAAVFGALWGSFFNVAVYRIGSAAAADESETWGQAAWAGLKSLTRLTRPPSHCPDCKTPIRWYDNVPIFGWLWLGGKCRSCKYRISFRYVVVELLGVGLALAVYWRFVLGEPAAPVAELARFFVYFFFGGALLVLGLIDLETGLLPLAITLPALPAFFVAGRVIRDVSTVDALVGLLVGFGSFFVLRKGLPLILKKEALGEGDEWLVGLIGGTLGWRALPVALFTGSVIGTLSVLPARIVSAARKGSGEKVLGVAVPFGPFLAAGGLIYMIVGREIWRWVVDWVTR